METQAKPKQATMMIYFLVFSAAVFIASFFAGGIGALFNGYIKILTSPAALTTDYIELGGLGAALFNAGLNGLIVTLLYKLSKVELTGTSFLAYFLVVGFSLYGMNTLNVAFMVFGVFVYSKIKKEPFIKFVNAALLSAALAPVISEVLFSYYIKIPLYFSIPLAFAISILLACLFVPMLAHAVNLHKGHIIFNAGVAAGFIAFLLFSTYRTLVLLPLGADAEYKLNAISSPGFPLFLGILFGALFAGSIVAGLILNRKNQNAYKRLITHTGHGADFTQSASVGAVFMNIGILGIMFSAYFMLIGAPINGPVFGAMLGIVACSASGSHPRNTLTILIGYILVSFLATWKLEAQGMCVALCYATGMAPLSGRYGYFAGILAGALHACIVPFVSVICGGLNLFNGSFTAGLLVVVLLPALDALVMDTEKRKLKKMMTLNK